jgi:hypothetical protein
VHRLDRVEAVGPELPHVDETDAVWLVGDAVREVDDLRNAAAVLGERESAAVAHFGLVEQAV